MRNYTIVQFFLNSYYPYLLLLLFLMHCQALHICDTVEPPPDPNSILNLDRGRRENEPERLSFQGN